MRKGTFPAFSASLSAAPDFSVGDFASMPLETLLRETDRRSDGKNVELCAIINAKNGSCAMDCRFCAQSAHHATATETLPLISTDELLGRTRKFRDAGVQRVGWVTSGCSARDADVDILAETAERFLRNDETPSTGTVCVSLGQLDTGAMKRLRDAGVRRYHHNLETSERFYPEICTTQRWGDRLATVERAKSLGMEVCSGGLFGLGESWEDRLDLARVLRDLRVDSVPLNFFSPIPGTPLAPREPLSTEEGLRIIALFRLVVPGTVIRICGGRPKTFGKRLDGILRAGARAVMTGDYLTTQGFSIEEDLEMIRENGYEIIP